MVSLTSTPCIRFDYEREKRTGLPEAVFCEGKPLRAVAALLRRFAGSGSIPTLFTRLAPEAMAEMPQEIQSAYDFDPISRTAWNTVCPRHEGGRVAVVSAGTADGFTAREASRTLEYLGWQAELFEDCGVAGLWRIEQALPQIETCDVIIVVAGLDAALASVLGGLTSRPIFAVPTSTGYGIAEHGRIALGSMLSSCSPGIGVFNIDNGYGAACAAHRVLRAMGF